MIGNRVFIIGLGAVLAVIMAGGPSAQAETNGGCQQFWIAPDGDDKARGTKAAPWRTVQQARDHLREKRLTMQLSCDIVINLKAGEYPVSETIAFGDGDSGSNGHEVIYRSVEGPGKAQLIGAEEVTGWEPYQDGIFSAAVDIDKPFHTLYVDGERATTARYPNKAEKDTWGPYLRSVLIEPVKEAIRDQVGFTEGEWDETWDLGTGTSWPAQLTIWSGGSWSWFTDTVPIKNPDWKDNKVTLDYWTRYAMINSGGGSRYWVQNSLDLLDAAGEYYLDYEAGRLYYKPAEGSMDGLRVLRPTVTELITIEGPSPDRRATNLTFDGLGFAYTDFVDWYRYGWISAGDSGEVHDYPEYDRQIEMPRNRFGAITLTNTKDVTFRAVQVADTGFTGIYALFANEGLTVADSLFENLGNDAIKIEGGYPGEGDLARGNTITNSYLHHLGELVPGDSAGVEIMNSGDNEISNLVIEHGARYGISLESRPEVINADNYMDGNNVHHVRLAHLAKDSGDTGAFYAYGVRNFEPYTPATKVSQMIIDDVHADPSMPDHPPYGVHMDFGGCAIAFSDIKVTNTASDPYHGPSDRVCSTFENVSWEDDFDESRLDPTIGLLPTFPY